MHTATSNAQNQVRNDTSAKRHVSSRKKRKLLNFYKPLGHDPASSPASTKATPRRRAKGIKTLTHRPPHTPPVKLPHRSTKSIFSPVKASWELRNPVLA